MEKLPHQEFRDELAGKLREIRNSDEENPELARAKAQGYLEAKKEEPRPENRRLTNYKESKKAHQRLNERGINFGEIEAVLNSLKTNQKLVVTAGGQERTIGSMFANASIEYEENTGKLEVALKYEDLFDGGGKSRHE